MPRANAPHQRAGHKHAPVWCDDCKRMHDGTPDDAATLLGVRGVRCGAAYVVHSPHDRCHGATFYTFAASDPIPRHGKARNRPVNPDGVTLDACKRCSRTRDAHTLGDGCEGFRSSRGAIAGATVTHTFPPSFLRVYVNTHGDTLRASIATVGAC